MDLSFDITGTVREKSNMESKELKRREINNILSLKKQLVAIGYNPCEVDYMIKTSSSGIKINKLDSEQLKKIGSVLGEQLDIARQCIDLVGDSRRS